MKFSEFWAQIQSLQSPKTFATKIRNRRFIAWYYPGTYEVNTYDGFKNPDPPQQGVVVIFAGKGLSKAPLSGIMPSGRPTYRDGT